MHTITHMTTTGASSKTITRELVDKTEHEANAILDMAKQLIIHDPKWGVREAVSYSLHFYEERKKIFNELTGKE